MNGTDVEVVDGKVDIVVPNAPIQGITTNGVALVTNEYGNVEIPLNEYVKISELQEGIRFNTMEVTNLTVNGKQVSLEGHTHTVEDV